MAETDDGNTVWVLVHVSDAWRINTALAVWADSLRAELATLADNDPTRQLLTFDVWRARILRDRLKTQLAQTRKH